MRSRVTPGWSWTMAWRFPTRRLKRVDLPTLGRPTMATVALMNGAIIAHMGTWCLSGHCVARAYPRAPHGLGLTLPDRSPTISPAAKVAELVDAQRSGRCGRKAMGVRVPPFAPSGHREQQLAFDHELV